MNQKQNAPKPWQFDLEEYVRQGEAGKAEKSCIWKTAIGLQDVDGLKISTYLLETAKEHIEGYIDIDTAQKRIDNCYETRMERREEEKGTEEADRVAAWKHFFGNLLLGTEYELKNRNLVIDDGFL